jgi:chromosome transmission fidelity protein 1
VTLPYPLLLQKSARESLGLSLKGHIIIIDEAHNLMDAISNIYSTATSASQLKRGREQLRMYLHRFRNKLKGKNRVYVAQLVRLLDSLSGFLDTIASEDRAKEGIVNSTELLKGKGVDQINLYKLLRYLLESKIARKVDGYHIHTEQEQAEAERKARGTRPNSNAMEQRQSTSTPVLMHLQGFLLALTNPSEEGRFFYIENEDGDMSLKYMLLDPTHHFKEIVDEARTVILAGGTMSPVTSSDPVEE